MFIEAVLYQARTGTPWRDLPDEFGHWNGVYHRFRRWEKGGLWERLWHRFQHIDDDPLSELFIDSTVVRAHQHATGASKKKRWATSPGSGPPFATTGGFSTKLHAACTDERTGVSFVLTGGQRNDAVGFESVWEGVPALPGLGAVVMDKAYDSNTIRQFLAMQGIEAVIARRRTGSSRFITMRRSTSCARRWSDSSTSSSNFAALPLVMTSSVGRSWRLFISCRPGSCFDNSSTRPRGAQ